MDDPGAVIDDQISRTRRATVPHVWVFHGIWGVVWLLNAVVSLAAPGGWPSLIAISVLWMLGALASGVYGVRFGAGVHGSSRRTGRRIGLAFVIGTVWSVIVAVIVAPHVPADARIAVGLAIVIGVLAVLGLAVDGAGVVPFGLLAASLTLLLVPVPYGLPLGAAVAGATLLAEAVRLWRAER